MDLVRIATAGSVDDGKSTLIGRLLFDSKAIHDDVLDAAKIASQRVTSDYLNLALITDGLRAEREQGITIDVAYRYFDTSKRKFILADTPGHVQYTRNMVTGASTAQVALVIVDARNGVVEQSRRHAVIAALLGIEHVVVCINKMDLVDFREERFNEIKSDFALFLEPLAFTTIDFIPISALLGDNVVSRSANMPWFEGSPVLEQLENTDVQEDTLHQPFRMPVQYVIRPMRKEYHDFRGYSGTIASGSISVGNEISVFPLDRPTTVTAIETPGGPAKSASAGTAVTLQIADDFAVSRGDVFAAGSVLPCVDSQIEATVCWMSESSKLKPGTIFNIKHTTKSGRAVVRALVGKLNVTSVSIQTNSDSLDLNELGQVSLRVSAPLIYDDYRDNRTTGSFILVDPVTNETVAAGMIGRPRFDTSH